MIAPRLKNYFLFDFLSLVILSPLSTKLLRLLHSLLSSPATGYSPEASIHPLVVPFSDSYFTYCIIL